MLYLTSSLLLTIFLIAVRNNLKLSFTHVLLIAITLRLIITVLFIKAHSYDTESFMIIGQLTTQGISIYPHQAIYHHPYLPFFLYIEAFASLFKNYFLSMTVIKLILTGFDLGIMWLMYQLSHKNLQVSLIYAINPISILVTNIHGQFDVIPLFFLLLAVYFLEKKAEITSVLTLSLAILTKTWPLLFIIPFWQKYKLKVSMIGVIIFPLAAILIYSFIFHSSFWNIIAPVKNYRGVYGVWGIGLLLEHLFPHLDDSIIQWLRRIFLISLVLFSFVQRRKPIMEQMLNLMFWFFSFTLTFGSHWLLWVIPFIIIIKPPLWKLYIIATTIYLDLAFSADIFKNWPKNNIYELTVLMGGLAIWIIIIIMFSRFALRSMEFSS